MNFKGIILAAVSFLLMAVSCSVENDAIMNDLANSNGSTESAGTYLSLNVTTSAMTKSVTNGGTVAGDVVKGYILFMIENGNNVISMVEKTSGENASVFTKENKNLKAVVVANADAALANALKSCTTYEAIKAITADVDSNNNATRFMVGEKDVNWETAENTDSGIKTLSLQVEVSARTAILSLKNFDVKYVGGNNSKPVVKLTSVVYSNLKENVQVGGTEATAAGRLSSKNLVKENNAVDSIAVYPNTTGGNPVKVTLKFNVTYNGKVTTEETRTYVINPTNDAKTEGSIVAGNKYQLSVTVNVGSDVKVDLTCSTLAWINNDYEAPATEI